MSLQNSKKKLWKLKKNVRTDKSQKGQIIFIKQDFMFTQIFNEETISKITGFTLEKIEALRIEKSYFERIILRKKGSNYLKKIIIHFFFLKIIDNYKRNDRIKSPRKSLLLVVFS